MQHHPVNEAIVPKFAPQDREFGSFTMQRSFIDWEP